MKDNHGRRIAAGNGHRQPRRIWGGPLLPLLAMAVVLAACGGRNKAQLAVAPANVTTIAVNSYLWRSALETLKFMPLSQVDADTGIIISDWYRHPDIPDERVKVTVAILDGALRADALQVAAERQTLKDGVWVPAAVRAGTVQHLEEAILEHARDLRQRAALR